MRLTDLETYSIHEAGHAVVALALGVPVSGMAVNADAKPGGWRETNGVMDSMAETAGVTLVDFDAGSQADQAMVALAGLAANVIANRADYRTAVHGAAHDIALLQGFMSFVPRAEWSMLAPNTFAILKARWAAVVALSAALAERGELYEEDSSLSLRTLCGP